jgi:hypothetical protein
MSLLRRNAKRDDSEPEIVEALQRAGASVQRLSGKDIPDLLIGWRGSTLLMECKTPQPPPKRKRRKPPSDGRTDGQILWAKWWRGSRVHVVTTPQEALAVLLCPPPRALPEIE